MSQSEHDRRIDYIEFPVADVGIAKRFYSAVFGWTFTDYGPDYSSFSDGRLSGGFRGGEAAGFTFAIPAVTSWRCGRIPSPGKRSRH